MCYFEYFKQEKRRKEIKQYFYEQVEKVGGEDE